MTRRIDRLTDQQRAAMPGHAQQWINRGLDTSEPDWAAWEAGVRACYRYAGLSWHGNVVVVGSPLVVALAAPVAARLLSHGDAVHGAVGGAVGDAVRDAVGDAVRGAVRDAVHDAVRGAVGGAVGDAVGDAVHDAVRGAVRGAVGGAVGDAVRDAVGDAVGDAVHDAVRGAVGDAVRDAVGDAVRDAVRDAVGDAVRDAVRYLGGQWWAGWQAWTSYFRDVCGLQLDGDLWDRDRAYAAAQSAGWWWPHRQFVIVSRRPAEIHLEQVAPTGWGSHRLHRADGPAIRWHDGWALHYWHGIRVPADLIEDGWPVSRILREPNVEVRRCAIERVGWDRFVADAGLAQVGPAVPDPGNPGADLALYDVPAAVFDEPVRVLVCRNGTPEADGRYRLSGLTVPADIHHAGTAAAWTYRLTWEQYAQCQRRT